MKTEAAIQKAILSYLELQGYVCIKLHMGGITKGNGYRVVDHKGRGFPDIMGVLKTRPGHMFAAEIKTQKGVVSDFQRKWLNRLYNAGVIAFVARDLETVAATLGAAERDPDAARRKIKEQGEY